MKLHLLMSNSKKQSHGPLAYATNNAFQFLEFTSVMEQIAQFYNVTVNQVLWTTGITFIGQIIGALPVAIIPEIFELRKSGISDT